MSTYSKVLGQNDLVLRGPRLVVAVRLPEIWARRLREDGAPVPVPVTGDALIDTGSSVSGLDGSVITRLGLPPVRSDVITTPTRRSVQLTYPAQMSFSEVDFPDLTGNDFIELELQAFGVIALLGRNALARFTLSYDGPAGAFTITG